jgi:hypothetical protein
VHLSRLRERQVDTRRADKGGGKKRELCFGICETCSLVNVGRRLSFMFKLGTEAGRKGNLFSAFGEIGKGDGRRGECGSGS